MGMTNKEAIKFLKEPRMWEWLNVAQQIAIDMAIDALSQQPCEDAISRQAVMETICTKHCTTYPYCKSKYGCAEMSDIKDLPPVTPQPKVGYCKDCKWWKDTDGAYRRGIGAESKCPINHRDVFEGNGYCYMFEPQESEDKK